MMCDSETIAIVTTSGAQMEVVKINGYLSGIGLRIGWSFNTAGFTVFWNLNYFALSAKNVQEWPYGDPIHFALGFSNGPYICNAQ